MPPGYFDWGAASTSTATMQSAVAHFHAAGYAVLTSFIPPATVATLRSRATSIIHDFHHPPSTSPSLPTSIFTTSEQTRSVDDNVFLSSASAIRCFLEETPDPLLPPDEPPVNKIGHALHDLDPVFDAFSRDASVRAVAHAVGCREAVLVQSMYILKNARVGGEVTAHRDATFVRGKEKRVGGGCVGYWWALEDARVGNGCLWAVPGSHRDGRERRRFVVGKEGGTVFEGAERSVEEYEEREYVALEMGEGDLVVLHGELVHKSGRNESGKSRHAYSIHVVEEGLEEGCWLQRPEDLPFRGL